VAVGSFFCDMVMKKAAKTFGFFHASSYLCIKYEQDTGSAVTTGLQLDYDK
jgi:hypothetical protein